MKEFEPNAVARIAQKVRYRGIAERFGKDPDEESVREYPARVTAKLVSTRYDRYDRFTGRDRSASFGQKPRRLVAYRLAHQDWVTVGVECPPVRPA